MKKIIFFVVWFALLVLVPVTILQTTPLAVAFKYPVSISSLFLRTLGLVGFILLFVQIVLGAFMWKLVEKIGAWIFKFHIFEGRLAYFFVFFHPILYMFFNHFIGGKIDPYAAFINICVLCKHPIELYYSFGRISFWLLTIAVLAAVFRNATPWLKKNWRKMHVLNYVVFLLVGAHGFLVGTDFRVQPFYTFAAVAYAIVCGIVIFVELPRLFKNFREWVRS